MDTIKRFFECLIPVTACNLKCSYCYVIQRNNRKHEIARLKYTPEQIGRALRQERLGGGMLLQHMRFRGDYLTERHRGDCISYFKGGALCQHYHQWNNRKPVKKDNT